MLNDNSDNRTQACRIYDHYFPSKKFQGHRLGRISRILWYIFGSLVFSCFWVLPMIPTVEGIPTSRVESLNEAPVRRSGHYVLYWMTSARRPHSNWALEHALSWASKLRLPLLVFEALRWDYPWVAERSHSFIVAGMAQNRDAFASSSVTYLPYVEPSSGHGRGLLRRLSADAAVVVTDYQPGNFTGRMQVCAAQRLSCRIERVDGNGLLPLSLSSGEFRTAHSFRHFLHAHLREQLADGLPSYNPLQDLTLPRLADLPEDLLSRWNLSPGELITKQLSPPPPDRRTADGTLSGGWKAGEELWGEFHATRLSKYKEIRNNLDAAGSSCLSPYLHFGHVSVQQIFFDLLLTEGWVEEDINPRRKGSRAGWWGLSADVESFLDQVLTWRELGYHFCHHRSDFAEYESLPPWALESLQNHSADHRPYVYELDALRNARTHDDIWNAAQRQLVRQGRVHNYLRMLWGKKILEWSPTPQIAFEVMIELNNRYALDGRDPNSYSGIAWCLGRFDRAWGPERAIFGKIRYMSSDNTRRKMKLGPYLSRWSESL
jgi:deoxyribodipyrimidine photo-lyase